jgi:hypothetical protein
MPTTPTQAMPTPREELLAITTAVCLQQPDHDLAVADVLEAVRERPDLLAELLTIGLALLPPPATVN